MAEKPAVEHRGVFTGWPVDTSTAQPTQYATRDGTPSPQQWEEKAHRNNLLMPATGVLIG